MGAGLPNAGAISKLSAGVGGAGCANSADPSAKRGQDIDKAPQEPTGGKAGKDAKVQGVGPGRQSLNDTTISDVVDDGETLCESISHSVAGSPDYKEGKRGSARGAGPGHAGVGADGSPEGASGGSSAVLAGTSAILGGISPIAPDRSCEGHGASAGSRDRGNCGIGGQGGGGKGKGRGTAGPGKRDSSGYGDAMAHISVHVRMHAHAHA